MKQERLNQKIFQVLSYIIKRELHPKNSVTFFREIDCSVIEKLRSQYGLLEKKKPSYTAFIVKAVSEAIAEHPFVNSRVFPGFPYSKIVRFPEINTAVACEKDIAGAEFMAFVDVIKQTDKKSIDAIQHELTQLANANIENSPQLRSFMSVIKNFPIFIARELCTLPTWIPALWMKYRGAGIVVSSPSKYGVDSISATWTHPMGVSFGLVQKKPIVKNNKVEIVPSFTLTLNWDRRIMAGAPAARFFNSIATNLMDHAFLSKHLEESLLIEERKIERVTAIA
jgi:pyruvate/2-oxoglutarate dehydrogenase complex dihydrolipoamide acyltransferase (E2) component